MLLTLDIGNTNITCGVFEIKDKKAVRAPRKIWRISSNPSLTADEYGVMLLDFLRHSMLDKNDITEIVAASVVPSLNNTLQIASALYLKKPFSLVSNKDFQRTKLDINVENPSEVGIDRLLNSLAAIEFYGAPALIIDFGTAITFDCVNKKKEYVGGAIMPGALIALKSLTNNTAKLPLVELKRPKSLIGRNTVECVQSGIFFGLSAALKYFCNDIKSILGKQTAVICTGGYAELFYKDSKEIKIIAPELTLEGLRLLWGRLNY